jgi:uncharacterized protein YfiM (DUF2279 family)
MTLRSSITTLTLAASLFISTPAFAGDDDWNDSDKLKHFAVSFVLGTASGAYFENKWTAFGVAMIPGLIKEISDSQKSNNHFSGKDLAADALGAALGVQLGNWIITSRGLKFQSSF